MIHEVAARRLLLLALGALGLVLLARVRVPPAAPGVPPALPADSPTTLAGSPTPRAPVEVVASGLEIPWALAFAPARNASPARSDPPARRASPSDAGGRSGSGERSDADGPDVTLYVTERPGRLVRIREGRVEKIADIPDVAHVGEGGLLGLALDPRFAENQFLYLYYTTRRGNILINRVVRYRLAADGLQDPTVILDGIPGARFHNGGRIAFGPDGNLYITTGDGEQPLLAPRLDSLAGKILRIRPDGSIPADNPFKGSLVYSYGHRNPQGLAWDAEGILYATEHGPSNEPPDCCHDEVNRIEAGKQYGWPYFAGEAEGPVAARLSGPAAAFVSPIVESGPRETWAPGGAAVVRDTLFFGGLRGESLFAVGLQDPTRVTAHFQGELGRLRDVVRGPDGALYIATSNRDGRGTPRPLDDRILRVDPRALGGR